EVAVAAGSERSDTGDGKGAAVIGEADVGHAERGAVDERRTGAAADRGSCLGGAEVEASVFTGDDVEWATGSDFDGGSKSEIADKIFEEAVGRFGGWALEDGGRNPAMALVVDGVGALEEWEAAVLRLERRLQVGAVIDRMRPGIAGEQLEGFAKALGQ